MKNYIKNIALCGIVASAGVLASCDDFLTITPTSSIVEEEFWKDKNDINNAVFACYKRMVGSDVLTKNIYWGELRSDNFERTTEASASGMIANIMNASLLPTYEAFNWTPMYSVINYCNKVLAHAPEVIKNDESFSENDYKPIHAEIIALRAIAHFNLVRAFGEIPYVTTDYNNDSQELRQPQITQLAVLDSLVNDLEAVKDDAMTDYGNTVLNKGRITRKAIYSILADVYLWRASYKAGNNQPFAKRTAASNYIGSQRPSEPRHEEYSTTAEYDYSKCVECCDYVINQAKKEKLEYLNKSGLNIGGQDIEITLADLLEQNDITLLSYNTVSTGSAYTAIFGIGNSDESIFELQVDGITYGNGMITSMYWNLGENKSGFLAGTPALFEGVEANPNSPSPSTVFTKTDYRRWEDLKFEKIGQTSFNISKYINSVCSQTSGTNTLLTDNTSTNFTALTSTRTKDNVDANWIVYRMPDIYLMKAEAMSQLSDAQENIEEAFKYVREVFIRSNPFAYSPTNPTAKDDSLDVTKFYVKEDFERLVLTERQREFFGEGKRWYDLVRYALRRGNTKDMVAILSRKYASNRKAIEAKLADIQSLFSPVYNNELKNNGLLLQNGVWFVNETSSKTDNL